jgi:hypothetical protein
MISITTGMMQRVYGETNTFCNFIGEALEMEALGTSGTSVLRIMVDETTATHSKETVH